jgi:hypothetical protein
MLKRIRRNQKKILAVFCVFGMISFLYGLVPNGAKLATDPQVATINGQPVYRGDLGQSRNEWQTLRELHYIDPNNPDVNEPFVGRLPFGAGDLISKEPDTFYLLVQEARARGMVPNNDEVQSILANNIENVPPEGSDVREAVTKCVSDFLLVNDLLTSDLQMIKTNAPARVLWKAREAQSVSLNLVMFSADHYLPQVPAPTEADIKNQFDKFNDRVAGDQTFGAADDPLGFGYKYPNRVKVQYIGLRESEVFNAAKASKSDQDWYVAAYNEFKANRDQYDAEPVAAPTTRPEPATQPTAQRLDDLDQDFTLHVQLVLNHIYQQAADDLQQKLVHQISDSMSAGFAAWHDAQAAGAATQDSGGGYTDMSFLQNLAQTIEKQSGVLPVVGVSDQLKDSEALFLIPGIGQTVANTNMGQPVIFAQFAAQDPTNGGLAVWQPSFVFQTGGMGLSHMGGEDSYIFRISQFDASHTPSLDEVRDKVTSDWKAAAAYKMALDAAKSVVADAQKRPWEAATAGMPVITTDPFQPGRIVAQPRQNGGIPPLKLSQQSIFLLAKDAQLLITAASGADGRPVDVAELWPQGIAAVVHLESATPLWDSTTPGLAEYRAYQLAMRDSGEQLIASLCTKDAASHRMNFQLLSLSGAPAPASP